MTTRRGFLIAGGAGLWLLAVSPGSHAQQKAKVWRVGFLAPGRSAEGPASVAFRQGMRELGYVEGRNLAIEWRFAAGDAERLPRLAAELVQLQVDIIVAATPSLARAAQRATATIPIVMVNIADPVAFGLVKSLARPGGNITGTATMISELAPKHLEMLLAVVPKLARVAVLVHPDDASHASILENIRNAAQRSQVSIVPAEARTAHEIEKSFAAMSGMNVGAVVVNAGLFSAHRREIAQLAMKHRLPSVAAAVQYAEAGGLMSYGPDIIEPYRRAATYVDKILKGAKPADLPVEQPTRFTLLVNGKSAKALGLTIPPSILVQATKVIE